MIVNLHSACYYLVQNLLSSHLSKDTKIRKIYKTINFPVVFNGYETWSLTLREEHRLRMLDKVPRRIFGPIKD
jgi:hypothetical protein